MYDTAVKPDFIHKVVSEPVTIKYRENEAFSGWIVDFGNTGLMLTQHQNSSDGDSEQHFLPDGRSECPKGMEMKYSLMYAQGLSALIKWYKDFKETKDGIKKPKIIFGCTNKQMSDFRQHLLGDDVYKLDNVELDRHFYTLNLEKLSNNQELVNKIDKLASRAEKMNYVTQFPTSIGSIS